MADALVWQLIKNNNAFLVKKERTSRRGQVMFSKESGNLMNVNSFKYSGIANSKTIGIDTNEKDITMTLKVIEYVIESYLFVRFVILTHVWLYRLPRRHRSPRALLRSTSANTPRPLSMPLTSRLPVHSTVLTSRARPRLDTWECMEMSELRKDLPRKWRANTTALKSFC